MNSLFTSARLKLTAFYTLTILLISGIVSGLFYYRTSQILEIEYGRLEQRFQLEIQGIQLPGSRMTVRRITPEDLEHARNQIIIQLLKINGLITLAVAVAGYILSGLTLRPIEASMEEQRRFVGDAAHELKTPITALKTSLEVNLMDESLGKPARRILTENLEDVTGLDHLVDGLLKLSKFDDTDPPLVRVDVAELINASVKRIKPLAKRKRISVTVEGVDQPLHVLGLSSALTELWTIFLDNAIKYSPEETLISVVVTHTKQMVKILISDQGVGISKKDLPHIFDRFYQADAARSKEDNKGYGLGLSVAQKIVKQHSGTILVKSVVGKGTTFTVTLPLA